MDRITDHAQLDALVARIFSISDVTTGDAKKGYLLRYRGRLRTEDSEGAYDQIAADLAPLGLTPLFRWDGDQHAILIVPGKPEIEARPFNPRVNLLMFILTLLSVLFVGWLNSATEPPSGGLGIIRDVITQGWPFALSLLAILGAHEFGHYLMGRHHGVNLSLPYFIPLPLPPFGTMGAVINMREQPKNRRHLLDIGLAGPIAGLVVAIPVLLIGLSLSTLDPIPQQFAPGTGITMEGNSILYLLIKYMMFGQLLPAPLSYNGQPEWLYWIQYFFTGRPYPLGGMDVILHPVALAGWGGILVTALNLIPAGQLDGGHAVYVLLGREKAQRLLPFIIGIIALLGLFFLGWWLMLLMIFFLGRFYAEPLDLITPLDTPRRALAIAAIVIFLLIFTPVPFSLITAPG